MWRARSPDRLKLSVPARTSAGETSTLAGGRAGVATPFGPVPTDAATGDGLATGLTVTAGADEGAVAPGAATHALAASNTLEKSDKRRTFICEKPRARKLDPASTAHTHA